MSAPLTLDDSALEALGITPIEIADAIETALHQKAAGHLHTAPKAAILPGGGRYMMSTLAVGPEGLTVVKTVTVSPDNPARGLPSINGSIQVYDAETGLLRAQLGANWITAVRTAGLSAVAARRMAPQGAACVAFIGAGVQARSHLDAFQAMFPLTRIEAFGRGQDSLGRLCDHATRLGLDAHVATTPIDALRRADIVVTSVPLDYEIAPFLDAHWLKPGAFAAITDLTIPWHPESLDAFGSIVVDDIEQERSAPKPMVAQDRITGDLTNLVMGDLPPLDPARAHAFAFRGVSLGDYAVAALALARAEADG